MSPTSPASSTVEPLVIGWKEIVDLPDLGLEGLKAKIDTGARTSSLHVAGMRVLEEHEDGTAELELELSPDRRRPEKTTVVRARRVETVDVTDSGGHREVRPVIVTELVLGGRRKKIRVTLTDRSSMLFRMILGRKTLEGDFLVDVATKYLHGGPRPRPRTPDRPDSETP
jgi:hypothetical protein